MHSKLPMIDKISYGAGEFGCGIVFQAVASYLVFYTTSVLQIPGSLVGLAVGISVVWDGITDPIMGYISDRTRLRRLGRRHIYFLVGTISIALTNYLLWIANPDWPTMAKFFWIFVIVVLVKTSLTTFLTPHVALGAELTADYNERTSIHGIRVIFFLGGILFASVVGLAVFFRSTPEYPLGQLNPDAYKYFGMTSSILVLIFGLATFFLTIKYVPHLPRAEARDKDKVSLMNLLFARFKSALSNKLFKYIVYGYLFTNIASALAGTLGLHVFTYTFYLNNNGIAIVIGTLFVTSIASQPVWVVIARKIDKKPAITAGLVTASAGCLLLLPAVFLRDAISGNFWYLLPFSLLTGFGSGGLFSIPNSMVADTIDIDEAVTGARSEGLYYGTMTMAYKLSQSIAIMLLGVLLDVIGFNAALPAQRESTQTTLGLIMIVGGLLSFFLARMAYNKYDLDKTKFGIIQEQIRIRKKRVNEANVLETGGEIPVLSDITLENPIKDLSGG